MALTGVVFGFMVLALVAIRDEESLEEHPKKKKKTATTTKPSWKFSMEFSVDGSLAESEASNVKAKLREVCVQMDPIKWNQLEPETSLLCGLKRWDVSQQQ